MEGSSENYFIEVALELTKEKGTVTKVRKGMYSANFRGIKYVDTASIYIYDEVLLRYMY